MKIKTNFSLLFCLSIFLLLGANSLFAQGNLAQKDSLQPQNQAVADTTIPIWVSAKGRYNAEDQRKFDLQHTKLEVSFDWEKQYLFGIATLTMQPYFYAQSEVILDAKGFDIQAVELVETKIIALQYDYNKRKLRIKLPKSYQKNEKIVLKITYTAKPNELENIGGSEAITSDKGLYFINPQGKIPNKPQQIWTQGETEASSCWFPTFDSPNIKTIQEIFITVDKQFATLSNGKLLATKDNGNGTKTDHWKQEKPHAPYLFMMAIGKFAIVKDKWKNIDVNYYVEPEYEKYAKAIFGNTPEMIDYFSKLLDYPYPWDKYSQVVVRDYVSGAMENTSASLFMEGLQVDNRYLIDENWDGIIAHELFHQWFGDLVTCESWANLPLNESFANYAELLWKEHKSGVDEMEFQLQEEANQYMQEAQMKREPMIRYYHKDKEDMFDSHSYAKGAVILHGLRKYVGDEAFFASLRLYLKKFAFKKAEIHDLRLAFEEVTGEDLNWFFEQWFMNAGHPQLTVQHSFEGGKVLLKVKQTQDLRYAPVYKLPLYVEIWVKGKAKRHFITITEKEQRFVLEAESKPDLVFFDAETQLLAEVTHEKTTEEYIFQYKNSPKVLARMEALNYLQSKMKQKEIRNTLLLALGDKYWEVRQLAAELFDKYEGEDRQKIAEKLRELIRTDKKSLVRATAINSLASFGADDAELFRERLANDSSYAVIGNSLYAYYNVGGVNAAEQFEKFEGANNLLIAIPIADFYSFSQTPNKYDWFIGRLQRFENSGLVYLLGYFGQYVVNQPKLVQQEAADYLEWLAMNHANHNTRIQAYQTLSLLQKTDNIEKRLASIRRKEKDKRVLDYYKQTE
jgi:aminopeptidase N